MKVKVTDDMLVQERQDSIGLSFDHSMYTFSVRYDENGRPISSNIKNGKDKKKKKNWGVNFKGGDTGDDTKKNDEENSTTPSPSSSSNPPKPSTPMTWWAVAICSLGLGGVFFGGWAAIRGFSDTAKRALLKFIMPAVSGAHGVVGGPYIVYQRRHIQSDLTLRELVDELRSEHNRLHQENEKLLMNVHFMHQDVDRLKEVANVLDELCETQQTTLKILNENIEENSRINAELSEVIKARTWQEMTSIILESDKNRDFTLENREIEGLIFRLKFVETLNVNEDMLRKELKEGNGSLNKFVKFVREALENGSTENDMISIKPLDVVLQKIKSNKALINTDVRF